MRRLRNNNGIALLTALLFTLISLAIIMALLTIVSRGTRTSAANKTYKTAVEATYGGVDVMMKDMLPAVLDGTFSGTRRTSLEGSLSLSFNGREGCFNEKVSKSTSLWDATACPGAVTTPVPTELPDVIFNLKATNDPAGYNVYAKITDTRCGGNTAAGEPCTNSDTSGYSKADLDAGGGVASASMSVTPSHRPAYFRIEVQSQRAQNPKENAKVSVLYAY